MLGGALVKRLYELHGQGVSIRRIAADLGIARNTVRTYLRAEGVPTPKPRRKRGSLLDPFAPYLDERLAAGVTNCVVLLRELRGRGYAGSYALLTAYVRPRRRPRQPKATVRFETEPGQQAQVDFGQCRYATDDGATKQVWVFAMVLSWSRALYVEFVARADEVTFLRCHHHAFVAFGGIPRVCLYDNTKLVVLARDGDGEPVWQRSFLDFCRRLGFTVERGIDYVKENFWPSARFTDLLDLNTQAQGWVRTVADVRIHGTTGEQPVARLEQERARLLALPAAAAVTPLLREVRKVGRDGFVRWDGSSYGVPWRWAGQLVGVQASATVVEVWAGEERLAVHPRATRPHQRFVLPGQWDGLPLGDARPSREPLAVQLPAVEVEARALGVYDALVGEGR
jgi:transposase